MENTAVSISGHVKRRSVSRRTLAQAIKEDLNLSSYVRGRRHLLTKKMKQVRVERRIKLHRICKKNPGIIKLISDEFNFTIDVAYKAKNDQWLSGSRSSVSRIMKTRNPSKAIFFGPFTSNETLMPLYIFPPKARLYMDGYVELHQTAFLPWLASHYPPSPKFMWI
uniref:Uncharacterized protein n=1 Tax=Lepeophtheirus salmonis TaxID=72036 RepID=A0A0K2TC69_LEPSM